MQRISWPQTARETDEEESAGRTSYHDTWEFTEQHFPWMLDTNGACPPTAAAASTLTPLGRAVTVTKIIASRMGGLETWMTSDGRAYLVQMVDNEPPDTPGDSPHVSRIF